MILFFSGNIDFFSFSCSHSIFDVDRKNETKEKLRKTLDEAKNEARSKTKMIFEYFLYRYNSI
jgi:hypothetical protein